MNKSLQIAIVVIGGIVLSALIFGAGMIVGRTNWGISVTNPPNMMSWISGNANQGYSMMGNGSNMMGNAGNGMMGGNGMLGGYFSGNSANTTPLTVDQTKQAVESYLEGINNSDLELKEIMIFDNNAYARISEKSTGIGAMELLVDPSTLSVYPEFGPNMMWNLKYGHMSGNNMMGNSGMMGGSGGMMGGSGMVGGILPNLSQATQTMTASPEQALKDAQQYLDQEYPGYQTAEDADPFYGYYTIDILKNGKVTGMLSVNGYSGQVFLHTWHGTFIEMWE